MPGPVAAVRVGSGRPLNPRSAATKPWGIKLRRTSGPSAAPERLFDANVCSMRTCVRLVNVRRARRATLRRVRRCDVATLRRVRRSPYNGTCAHRTAAGTNLFFAFSQWCHGATVPRD